MKKAAVRVLLAVTLLALTVCATADASYFMTRRQAISFARDWVHYQVGYPHSQAYCRPQWANDADPRYIYHRWVCGWRGMDENYDGNCRGAVRISGSHTPGHYWSYVLWHAGPCDWGWSSS